MLDVRRSPELQAALLGMRQARREIARDINKEARRTTKGQWLEALRARAVTRADDRIIVRGARTAITNNRVSVKAATSTRPLSGGLVPSYQWQGTEFGMTEKVVVVKTRRGSGPRVVGRQFRSRSKHGRVAFDAASKVGTQLVAGWVKSIIDGFRGFAEIKGGR